MNPVWLSSGNGHPIDLNKYIEAAILDRRDIVLWTKYEKLDGDVDYKRQKDFSNAFKALVPCI